ncbi:MAG TPA: adenylate/guanylate cyclase domain-containing protein [Candidatus Competibacteraceae bacterium]|nr:adenylate/guanylate cyclase domain-containing protein [Candidatus Competibacteraceae bacterium]
MERSLSSLLLRWLRWRLPLRRWLRLLPGPVLDTGNLPERVQERIRHQQESSEIVIGWVQLGLCLMFATVHVLHPGLSARAAGTDPVGWALLIYLAFTVLRLALAYRCWLPDWLVYLSCVFDVALLMAVIWSFHLEYQQPPGFYLKSPGLLYAFVFIAVRALRFQAGYVVVTGLAACAGWLSLVAYAVLATPPGSPPLTADFAEYLSSDRILLIAEMDKIVALGAVTAILGLALVRARRLLERALIEGSAARELARFVPRGVARHVALAERSVQAGQGAVREATILFIDIEGFTALSEHLSPPQLVQTLNEYFAVATEPLERHGGVITQFQGDAILACFNLPDALPEHAARAVAAALEIQQLLQRRRFGDAELRLRARIGINTGIVVGGLVGTATRLGYTVHGDAVNLAARLQELNKHYGTALLVADTTHRAAGDGRFAFRRVDEVQVRGRSRTCTVYTVDQP